MPRPSTNYTARSGATAPARKLAEYVPDEPAQPESLDDLPASVRPLFEQVSAELEGHGRRAYDAKLVRQFCYQAHFAEQAAREVARDGVCVMTADGGVKPHPAVRIARESSAQVIRLATALGISPEARARMGLQYAMTIESPLARIQREVTESAGRASSAAVEAQKRAVAERVAQNERDTEAHQQRWLAEKAKAPTP